MKKDASLIIRKHTATYLGQLGATTIHQHGAPVLLIGLSGRIRLNFQDGPSIDCYSALIDSNVAHSLDPQGERIATIYTEVSSPETQLLKSLYLKNMPYVFDIIKPSIFLHRSQQHILNFDLSVLLGLNSLDSMPPLDARVVKCFELLNTPTNFAAQQEVIAAKVMLSSSRLNHLFKQTTGISYRRYRLWSQLRFFMQNVKSTNNLTESALNSGFFDASHLSNSYRKLFGSSPAALLNDLGHFEVDLR